MSGSELVERHLSRLAVVMAAMSVGACGLADPYADFPLRPVGYSGKIQIWEEVATGCVFASNTSVDGDIPKPLMAGSRQVGCRPTQQEQTK